MAGTRAVVTLALAFVILVTKTPLCVSETLTEISCYTETLTSTVPYEKKPIILPNATICEPVEHSRKTCTRILGTDVLIDQCSNGSETKAPLVFQDTVKILYLANISLNAIDQSAFVNTSVGELKELFLSDNLLSRLHTGSFIGLSLLETLDLVYNSLHTLHLGAFDGLESLASLYLWGNLLEQLQSNIFRGLTKLRVLSLKDNRLIKIHPGALNDLIDLRFFNLDLNQLTEVPGNLFSMSKVLEEFDLDDNFVVKVPAGLFEGLTEMVELDLDNNIIEQLHPYIFKDLTNLEELELDENNFVELPSELFDSLHKLKALTISYNYLRELDRNLFSNLTLMTELHLQYNDITVLESDIFVDMFYLETLYIDHNKLSVVHFDLFQRLIHLKILSLAENQLTLIQTDLFRNTRALAILNISRNNLDSLESGVFQNLKSLVILDLTHNPLLWVNNEPFADLQKTTTLYVDNYATCCFVPKARCSFESPRSPFLSCKRLLPYSILRAAIWLLGIGSICGNLFVLYTRCRRRSTRSKVQFLLITNLSLSDLIMGIYLIILVFVDMHYSKYFPSHSESWRRSALCRFSGALSILSSEASVFFITLISFDRFMGVKFPFANSRLGRKSASVVASILWMSSFLISIASILISLISPNLYDASEICVGLPISRVNSYAVKEVTFKINTSDLEPESGLQFGRAVEAVFLGSTSSMYFSIAIFTVLNFFCFLFVAFCYVAIFIVAKQTSREAGRSRNIDDEIRTAFKMAAVVFSDFCCWMVVVVLSILLQSSVVTINPVAYAWIATFIMPINSCLNPFLYTLSTLISDRIQRIKRQNTTNDSVLSISRSVGVLSETEKTTSC